ncbi:MAG TPA: hypothetical protein PKI67_02195 [bacterium]|nr:hypothetical protein [bacterium]
MNKNFPQVSTLISIILIFNNICSKGQNLFFTNFTTLPPPSTAVVPDYSYLPGSPLVVGQNNFAQRVFYYNHLYPNGNPAYPRIYCTHDLQFGYDYWTSLNPGYWGEYPNQQFELGYHGYNTQGPQTNTGIYLAGALSNSSSCYYTLRVRLNGLNNTEGIIFKTPDEPISFYAVSRTPSTNSVPANTPVTINFERSAVSAGYYYVKYSNDNWLTYNLAPVTFTSGIYGSATIPGYSSTQSQVSYIPIFSPVNLTSLPSGDDINLYTLSSFYSPTNFYSVSGSSINYTNVTFRVNMSGQTVASNGVYVAGSFNNWNSNQYLMTAIGNNEYEATIPIISGSNITYKFVNGTSHEIISGSCTVDDGFGNANRFYVVPQTNSASLNSVCFESCNNCNLSSSCNVTFSVNMSNETVSMNGIFLCGTFNGFTIGIDPMINVGGNIWEKTITLPQGMLVQYKFVNGTNWENLNSVCASPDINGNLNREYTIPANIAAALNTVCFNECINCTSQTTTLVKFSVNMNSQTISPSGVFLAGTFNGFSPTANPMMNVGGGLYELIMPLNQNTSFAYKFVNGNQFENVPASCGQDDGGGIYNRIVTTTNRPIDRYEV